jgi:hypothetical protein
MLDVPPSGGCGSSKTALSRSEIEQIPKDIFIALVAPEFLPAACTCALLEIAPLAILPGLFFIKPCLEPLFPEFVVELPLLFLTEALIGMGYLLEFLLGFFVSGIYVRMPFPGKFTVGLFYFIAGCALLDPQNLVKIFRPDTPKESLRGRSPQAPSSFSLKKIRQDTSQLSF